MASPPYYQITYQVDSSNYTFFILFDYIQDRVIRGNATLSKWSVIANNVSASAPSTPSTPSVSSASSSSTSSISSSSSSQNQNQQAADLSTLTFKSISNYKTNQAVSSALSFLSSSSFPIDPSMLAAAEQSSLNSMLYYRLIITLYRFGSILLQNPLYYQFVVTSQDSRHFKLINATYTHLKSPNFVNLTSADIQKDTNIQAIARFLLSQNYAMLRPASSVVSVSRDFPYYKLVFDNQQNVYVTLIVVFNFYSSSV